DLPFQHLNAHTESVAITEVLEAATLEVHEGSANFLLRVVAPGCGIRRGSGKQSNRRRLVQAEPHVASVNGFEARGIRQEESSKAGDKVRLGIVVKHSQVISAVDQILQA